MSTQKSELSIFGTEAQFTDLEVKADGGNNAAALDAGAPRHGRRSLLQVARPLSLEGV